MRYLLSLIFSVLLCSISFSQEDAVTKVATSAANWLKIDNGVRGIGMGGSQVASGRGVSGVYYNPSSIAFIESSELFYSKSKLFSRDNS